jgi:hypothetical protein
MKGQRQKGTDREKETESKDRGEETEGRYIGGETEGNRPERRERRRGGEWDREGERETEAKRQRKET